MSGHSKWANIKHKKAAADAKRGKVFTRIAKEITIAARDGGGDPDANPRLRLAIQNARSVNMPSENIKRAIKKGTGEIEGVTYEEVTYEGFTPGGVSIIVETVTDNRNRTFSEIRAQFGKHGGNLGEQGSVAWNFDRKGVIVIKTNGKSEDDLLELILESDAEDLEFDEEVSHIVTPFEELANCSKYLEEYGIQIDESKFEYVPKTLFKINTVEEARKVLKFIDAIEEHDDVQNVFSNFDIPDNIMEQLEKS
jgi:YebC/PmpR family DNA-binding regulatory protein